MNEEWEFKAKVLAWRIQESVVPEGVSDGWEPFAVTTEPYRIILWLKRRKPTPQYSDS